MSVKRCLSTASASASAAASASTSASAPAFPPPASTRRPSELLEAYVSQPVPPPPERSSAWRRDPFSLMAYSPVRECVISKQRMPSAFMVNFRLGEGEDADVVLPDRMEHPKFRRRRQGRSFWAALHEDALERVMGRKGLHMRFLNVVAPVAPNASVSADVPRLVCEGLAERVVQEATLLADALAGDGAQRHVLGLADAVRAGPRIQPTRDGHIVALLDMRVPDAQPAADPTTHAAESFKAAKARRQRYAGTEPAPLTLDDVAALPEDGMLSRHDGPATIPLLSVHGLCGERAAEAVRLLRAVRDEDVLVLHVPSDGEPLANPLLIALWRRLLLTGRGWKTKQ